MAPYGSGSLEGRKAGGDRVRRAPAAILVAVLWIALVAPLDASAQEPPWDIEGIQRRLVELGYETGGVDGLLGAKTRAALRAFQADRGLPENGLPDGPTQDALFAPEPQESAAEAPPASDDPPPLDDAPEAPVAAAPPRSGETPSPHPEVSVDTPAAQAPDGLAPDEPEPTESLALAPASAPARETPDTKSRKQWLAWSAAGLGALGLLLVLAGVRGRSKTRKPADVRQPRPAAQPVAAESSGVGHVFGVDVPHPLRLSQPGKRGSGGAG